MATDDPRPTYQWRTWQDALLALRSAGRATKPRLARSSLWTTPGDRPPEIEDFTRLRAALAKSNIEDHQLEQLTALARRRSTLTPALRPHRLRLVRALRRHRIIPDTVDVRTSTTRVEVEGKGEIELRTTHLA